MFQSYDLSFDGAIKKEMSGFKEQLKQQQNAKDLSISLKEKELDKAHLRFLEAKSLADDKNNHIRVL